ncbi:MAG: hypothetical protein WA733_21790 [Methylocystis sp.]
MKKIVTMREALEDPNLLGSAMDGPSWLPMKALCIAAMGEKLTDEERVHFQALTKREREPLKRVKRFVVVAGRRSGKSYQAACCCLYLGVLCNHSENLNVGEKGIVLLVAENIEQAKIVFDYAVAIAEKSPVIAQEIESIHRQSIKFKNGIEIQVRASSPRGLRGPTVVGVVYDELAHWYRSSGPTADKEVTIAVRPALMTTKGMEIAISTPYARAGVFWDFYKQDFGPAGDPNNLVAQGETKLFNTTIDPAEIDKELAKDPIENTAEWLALFRDDIESAFTRETIEACTVPGRTMLPYQRRFEGEYICFTDPSGARGDEFTLAIAHSEKRDEDDDDSDFVVVLDYLTGSRNFSPDALVKEFCEVIKSYHATDVWGDNYAAELTQELFNKNGVTYNLSELNKSQIYSHCIPILNSPGRCELLDDKIMAMQFVQLERRVGRGTNRDSIDHPQNSNCHDDRSNAAAGAIRLAASGEIGSSSVWLRL